MKTHEITTPNKRPLTPLEEFKVQLASDYQKQIVNYFKGDKEAALKFISAVVYSVQKTPALLECSRESLITAFITCAEFRLYPSSASGEAYVLPYAGKAQFQLGYKGIVTLGYRAGVLAITSEIIREKDVFEYEEGLEPKLVHKPDPFKDRGEAIGAYAIAHLEGGVKVAKVLGKEQILNFKEMSQAKNTKFTPWNSGNDPELWMWRKTCVKQLAKLIPQNDEMQRAIEKDNQGDGIIKTPLLDAAGPAVGRALHEPEVVTDNEHGTDNTADQ